MGKFRVVVHDAHLELHMKYSKQNDAKASRSILHLNLHREYFAQIVAKEKRIEYRKQTPYWKKRLEGRKFDAIQFRNGYSADAPEIQVEFLGIRRYGKGKDAYYAIRLGRILSIRRWKG